MFVLEYYGLDDEFDKKEVFPMGGHFALQVRTSF